MMYAGAEAGKNGKNATFRLSSKIRKRNRLVKEEYLKKHDIIIKDEIQIQGIRESCRLASKILDATCQMAKEGVTTLELNDFSHRLHLEAGAIPAPLNYGHPPFPKSICTSLNDVICHGIPGQYPSPRRGYCQHRCHLHL